VIVSLEATRQAKAAAVVGDVAAKASVIAQPKVEGVVDFHPDPAARMKAILVRDLLADGKGVGGRTEARVESGIAVNKPLSSTVTVAISPSSRMAVALPDKERTTPETLTVAMIPRTSTGLDLPNEVVMTASEATFLVELYAHGIGVAHAAARNGRAVAKSNTGFSGDADAAGGRVDIDGDIIGLAIGHTVIVEVVFTGDGLAAFGIGGVGHHIPVHDALAVGSGRSERDGGGGNECAQAQGLSHGRLR